MGLQKWLPLLGHAETCSSFFKETQPRLPEDCSFACHENKQLLFARTLRSKKDTQPGSYPYSYAGTWANLRKCFANFYKGDFYGGSSANNNPSNRLPGLQTMLDMLGLEFEGTPHSGVDDARNIARILVRLLSDRAFVRVNEKILINNTSKADDDNRSAARLANVIPVTRREAEKWFRAQKKEVQTFVSSEQQDEHKIIDKSTLNNTPLL